MVRSNQPLVERMALIWHDWFATSNDKVAGRPDARPERALPPPALGSFANLLRDVTARPGDAHVPRRHRQPKGSPNENYAREVMELFTLGADRGAYTETDIRQAAKALTGWRADWVDGVGLTNFRFDANRHDNTTKIDLRQGGRTTPGRTSATSAWRTRSTRRSS